jgi:hypothetical protein
MDDKDGLLGAHLSTREEFRSFKSSSSHSEWGSSAAGGDGELSRALLGVAASDFGSSSIGKQLLESMGWKEGQQVGRRVVRANTIKRIATIVDEEDEAGDGDGGCGLVIPVGANISAIPKAAFDSATGLFAPVSVSNAINYDPHPPKKLDSRGAGFKGGLEADPSLHSSIFRGGTQSLGGENGEVHTALLGSAGGYSAGGNRALGKTSTYSASIKRGTNGFALDDEEDDVYDDYTTTDDTTETRGDVFKRPRVSSSSSNNNAGNVPVQQHAMLGYDFSVGDETDEVSDNKAAADTQEKGERHKAISNYLLITREESSGATGGLCRYHSDGMAVLPGFTLAQDDEQGQRTVDETPITVPLDFSGVHTWDTGRKSRFNGTVVEGAGEGCGGASAPPAKQGQMYEGPAVRCGENSNDVEAFIAAMTAYVEQTQLMLKSEPTLMASGAEPSAAKGLQSRFALGKTLAQETEREKAEERDKEEEPEADSSVPGVVSSTLERKTSSWDPKPLLLKRFRVKQDVTVPNAGGRSFETSSSLLSADSNDNCVLQGMSAPIKGEASFTNRPIPPRTLLKAIFAPDERPHVNNAVSNSNGRTGKDLSRTMRSSEAGLAVEASSVDNDNKTRAPPGRIMFKKPAVKKRKLE